MKSIRISEEAYLLVQREAALMSRSIAQQFEHWVRLGMSLEASDLTSSQLKDLLQGALLTGPYKDLPAELRQSAELIAGRIYPAVTGPQERVLRRRASSLLKKHFEMQYGELTTLPAVRRQQLAQEVLAAEAREHRDS